MMTKGLTKFFAGMAIFLTLSGSLAFSDEPKKVDFCSENIICPQVIACGVNKDGILRTFSTPCQALCEDFQPIYYTACKRESIVCTAEYKPVCGRALDGQKRTFSNRCVARANQATRVKKGTCEDVLNERKNK